MKDINKYIPKTQTYEVKYVEVKEPSKLSTIAGYLGVKVVYNCNDKPVVSSSSSTTIKATPSTQSDIVASAIRTTSQVGGSVEIKTSSSGSTTVNYDSGKSAK